MWWGSLCTDCIMNLRISDIQEFINVVHMLKRIFFILLAVCASVTLYSQGFTSNRGDSALSMAEKMLGAAGSRTTSDGSQVIYKAHPLEKEHVFGAPRTLYYNKLYYLGEVTDTTAIFSHTRGIYMGGYIQEKNKPTFFRNGFGIDRIMDDSSIDDVIKYEYYIGFYKKNRRHGEGYLVRTSGKTVAGKWRRGRLKTIGRRDLTPQEQKKVGDFIRQLQNMM